MSMLGARTKKVTTYGRKQTRIVNIHADFSPSKASPVGRDESALLVKAASPAKGATPVKPIRMPLQSKDHIALGNAPATPLAKLSKTSKGKKQGRESEVIVLHQHARRGRKVLIPRSPSNSPQTGKTLATPKYRDTKPRAIPTPKLLRGEWTICVESITGRLNNVKLDSNGANSCPYPDTSRLMADSVVKEVIPFESAFSHPRFLELLPGAAGSVSPIVLKLGEASYSEVFSVAASEDSPKVVVKVIPLLGFSGTSSKPKAKAELPDCSEVDDVVREVQITRRMSSVPGGGFVDFLGTLVVEGQYPQHMLDEWDRYKSDVGSESIRPDAFPSTQRYACVALANGGTDLESFQFDNTRGWVQAASLFWQVADALARAEEWTNFEHRDLHEGQILIRPVDCEPPTEISNYLDPLSTGVQATIIDFGLSRLDMEDGTASTPPPDEVFEGEGNQWDVYRAMRRRVQDAESSWTDFHPITNALWLQYLAGRLLRSTRSLRKPYARRAGGTSTVKTAAAVKARAAKTRAEAAWAVLTCVDMAFSSMLALSKRPTRGQPVRELGSARDVMAWGRDQGWVL